MTGIDFPDPPLPGFGEPLALLRACHSKILTHCDLLERVAASLEQADPDFDNREAARKVIGYFSSSARLHHQDEEQDLFPLLVRQSLKTADLVNDLRQEHNRLDDLWQAIEPGLRRIPEPGDPAALVTAAAEFCSLNRAHVQRENTEFLPVAESSLSHQQLEDIGRAMAKRRGARYSPSS